MVTLNDARKVIAAAEKKAAETGRPMNIADVDAGGNLRGNYAQGCAIVAQGPAPVEMNLCPGSHGSS